MNAATFAVPGDIDTPTGGYAYARRLLMGAEAAGLQLRHLRLPGGFPVPTDADLAETAGLLGAAPAGQPLLIDGLALGAMPAALIRSLRSPVVALCHHPLALESGLPAATAETMRRSEREALAACERVVTTSATTARILSDDYGVPSGRLAIAPPGTDPEPRAVGSYGPGVAMLAVGSLTPRKGHDVLIDALAGIDELDWRLDVVGPADRNATYAGELARRIAEHGLDARIRLVGALAPGELARAYARSDLFVLASRYEGFGMVFAEAMAHGLPVVGCAAGAVAEATRGAAQLVPPDDPAALRNALAALIGDPQARAGLALACRKAAEELPRWPGTCRIIAGVLAGVSP